MSALLLYLMGLNLKQLVLRTQTNGDSVVINFQTHVYIYRENKQMK